MHCERPALIIAAQLMHKQRSETPPPQSATHDQIAAALLLQEAAGVDFITL